MEAPHFWSEIYITKSRT